MCIQFRAIYLDRQIYINFEHHKFGPAIQLVQAFQCFNTTSLYLHIQRDECRWCSATQQPTTNGNIRIKPTIFTNMRRRRSRVCSRNRPKCKHKCELRDNNMEERPTHDAVDDREWPTAFINGGAYNACCLSDLTITKINCANVV